MTCGRSQISVSIVLAVFLVFNSKAQEVLDNLPSQTKYSDSIIRQLLHHRTYWTQWGPFSTLTDFAELKFIDNYSFIFKRGRKFQYKTQKNTVILESHTGIWSIQDAIVTMKYLDPAFGIIERQLEVVQLNELKVVNFSNLLGQSQTLWLKPYAIQ